MNELVSFWRSVEKLGFEWISCWDHLVAVKGERGSFEALVTHAALACHTRNVRIGVMVYALGYRHPAMLASAVATVDHLSSGRTEIGLGAGRDAGEYKTFGIEFPTGGERLQKLEEAIEVLKLLLHDGGGSWTGEHYSLADARLSVPPIQSHLPIWIGGVGEERLIPLAARQGDGWDAPLGISAELFGRKARVLMQHAEKVGRDPAELERSAHVAIFEDYRQAVLEFGDVSPDTEGLLIGSDDFILDAIRAYEDAGATRVLFSLNASGGTENLERAARLLSLS